MKAIFKYENGAEEILEVHGELFPDVFRFTAKEMVNFYFRFVDQLPSGTLLFKETSREEAMKMGSGR